MMSNPSGGGSFLVPSGMAGQSVLMPRSSFGGAGMMMSSAGGGNGYLMAGGGMPQYMMSYPGMAAGLPLGGAASDAASAYSAGNPYGLQMGYGTTAMYGEYM